MFSNSKILLISIFLLLLINFSNATVLIKAVNKVKYYCEKNVYYIIIDVIFSEKPPKEQYPFTLKLSSPEKLEFKCMLYYNKSSIICFRSFSDVNDFIEETSLLHFPYPFPEIDDIEWDYETFLENIYRNVWKAERDCGNDDIFNITDINYKKFEVEGKITHLGNGQCKTAAILKENIHKYFFDIELSFEKGTNIDLLKASNDNSSDIELIQEIWVPILPREEKKSKNLKTYERKFPFAICKANEKLTQINYSNFVLNCYIPISTGNIFNGVIRIKSFFFFFFIKQGDKIFDTSIFIRVDYNANDLEAKEYVSLDEQFMGIICPNQPLFTIDSKDKISMGEFYDETNKYTFFLTGTLSNGYYVFKNGTTVVLNETYYDYSFDLVIEDNLLDIDENERNVSCLLPYGTPLNIKNEALIKCIGVKEKKSNQNHNVDITLNLDLKANNNFENIIISWPKTYDESNIKNIYSYELTGLSIRQSNFACHNNNFDFYVYIYNLYQEPKLSFNLPLTMPKNGIAFCEIFDQTALKCSLNLKHKKLYKGEKVMLPPMGTENDITTSEGNKIIFIMNNYSNINNDHDFYVKLEESCGDYMVVGTLKDMGVSHKTSVALYILIIAFICLFILGLIAYISYKIRLRYKRGSKLTTSEETKGGNTTVGAKA